jgi:hypothetical protein
MVHGTKASEDCRMQRKRKEDKQIKGMAKSKEKK